VLFHVPSFATYGQLSGRDRDDMIAGARVEVAPYKKDPADFVLWKPSTPDLPGWDSPWGRGRPGWHIECSAMSTALLGDQIDIHCGGVDNIFPHHEAEIAQSEGCTGKQFVSYWLHCAHLLVEGQKMAKSLKNFYTITDLTARGFTGREIRYALLRVNYRMPLNFTWSGLDESRESLSRIDDWLERLTAAAAGGAAPGDDFTPPDEFGEALDDDLNISAALGFLFETIRETNRAMDAGELSAARAAGWLAWWSKVNEVLQLNAEDSAIPAEVIALADDRDRARLAKDWKKSDQLRDELQALGWDIRDTKDGRKLTRRSNA